MGQLLGAAYSPPQDEGEQRDSRHHGHKDESHLVDSTLHGSLAALCLLHHLDDVGQGRILAYLLGAEAELALLQDGACKHLAALLLEGGRGLTSDHRLVDIGTIGQHEALGLGHLAVDGYFLARMHLDHVAHLDGRDGHLFNLLALGAALHDAGRLGSQAHEGANAAGRAFLGLLLKQTAREHKGDNHHACIVVGVPLNATATPHSIAPESIEHAEQERDTRAQGHQSVHVGRAVAHLLESGDIELPATHGQVAQREHHGHHVGGLIASHGDESHRDAHHRKGKKPGGRHLVAQAVVARALDGFHIAVALDDEVVAYVVDLALHRFERNLVGVVGDIGRARGQRHRGALDAGQRVELAVDVGRAGRAGHAQNRNRFFDCCHNEKIPRSCFVLQNYDSTS